MRHEREVSAVPDVWSKRPAQARQGRHTSVVGRRRLALVVASVVFLPLSACSLLPNGWSDTCVDEEEAAVPQLEQVAEETLADVDSTLSRYSGCEDKGEPDVAVIADVPEWRQRRDARDLLAGLGWTEDGTVTYLSPNGRFIAQVVMVTVTGVPRHPAVYFYLAD
jgi:hypothetical protein